ncbi:hypothetical protein AO070_19940 [Pseudomonas syringae pv. syringae PD2766]|nr:hypothetical protein AO070_19940 [Pseudomonas syringae pv. syringae PD2766]
MPLLPSGIRFLRGWPFSNARQLAGDGAAPADFSDHLRSVDGSQKYTVRYLTICLPGLFQRVAKCKLVGYI